MKCLASFPGSPLAPTKNKTPIFLNYFLSEQGESLGTRLTCVLAENCDSPCDVVLFDKCTGLDKDWV